MTDPNTEREVEVRPPVTSCLGQRPDLRPRRDPLVGARHVDEVMPEPLPLLTLNTVTDLLDAFVRRLHRRAGIARSRAVMRAARFGTEAGTFRSEPRAPLTRLCRRDTLTVEVVGPTPGPLDN